MLAQLRRAFESGESNDVLARHAAGLAAFALVYAFLLHGITVGKLYAFGDFPPFYGARAFAKFTETWHAGGLGFPYIYNVLPAYLGAITQVGGVLAQNAFFLALIPAGFLTFLVFVGRFVDSVPARYLAAGVYAINPLTIGEFVNGGLAALIAFVGLPLVLHYLYAIVERDDPLDVVKAAVVFGATTASPWLVFWMVCPFATHLAVRARKEPRKLASLCVAGAVGIVLALPSVHHILQRVAGFGEGKHVIVQTLKWNYAYSNPLVVLRLAGNRGVMAMNELGYNTEPELMVGLVIPAVGLVAWRRQDLYAFYAIAATIVSFIVLTAMGLTYGLFEVVPVLLSVRNPVKLQYPLLVCLSVLFGAGVETVLAGGRRQLSTSPLHFGSERGHRSGDGSNQLMSAAVLGLLVLSLVSYAMPAAGALGLEQVREDDYYVDDEYERVGSELDGKVLWVPYGYTTQMHLRDTQPDHVGIRSGGVAHGIPNTEYVESLFRDFAAGRPVDGRLSDLGVRYVVVESDPPDNYGEGSPRVVEKWGAPWLWGDPATMNDRLNASDAYRRVDERGDLTVYRVKGVSKQEDTVERTGLHAVVAPTNPSVERIGDTLVGNARFDDGLEGWWTPPNTTNRETRLVETGDGGHAVSMSVDGSADRLPLATAVETRDRHPYRVAVESEGNATVNLVWFDGEVSPENRVGRQTIRTGATPTTVIARGSNLSIRVVPNASSDVLVRSVNIYRTTYPPSTGAAASDGVPGVTVDGRTENVPGATVVASNLDRASAQRAGADVRIVDAETLVGSPLVFDSDYRQGVAVRLDRADRPANVPADAKAVTDETADGRVVDYWVVGEFDDSPVTVMRTSYHEGWEGPPNATHFRADGWANGFTDARAEEVRWTNGAVRTGVVGLWAVAWAVVLGTFALGVSYRLVRRRRNQRQSHAFETL